MKQEHIREIEAAHGLVVPKAYAMFVRNDWLANRSDPLTFGMLRWMKPEDVARGSRYPDTLRSLVPFARNGFGNEYSWYLGEAGDSLPVYFCPHDESVAELYANDFEHFLLRQIVEHAVTVADDNEVEESELRERREFLANVVCREWLDVVDSINQRLRARKRLSEEEGATILGGGWFERDEGLVHRPGGIYLGAEEGSVANVRAVIDQLVGSEKELLDNSLMAASASGTTAACSTLLDAGADPNARRAVGDTTPLMATVRSGNIENARVLLSRGALTSATDANGRDALSHAVALRNAPMVDLLLKCGADVNASDTEGRTALMLAAYLGYGDIVQRLTAAGAEREKTDRRGRTALSWADEMGHTEVATILHTEREPEH